MITKKIALLVLVLSWGLTLGANDKKLTKFDYIELWKDEAVLQMIEHNIPASITLAQGILESAFGNSTLATKANNHFGIKCHGWKGKKVYHDDDKRQECFRKYNNAWESYEDHSLFLKQPRYQFLYTYKITDYKSWAKGLKKAGYATDPKYPKRLISIIEENNLTQYDQEGYKAIKKGVKPNRKNNPKVDVSGDRPVIADVNEEKELPTVTVGSARKVTNSKNRINYVFAKPGDTFESIALDMDMMPWQLWKYNDMDKKDRLKEGQIVYIQPKRNNGSKKWHTLKPGETLWDVSQMYGIKLKKLYKKNGLNKRSSPSVGTKISLKKNMVK